MKLVTFLKEIPQYGAGPGVVLGFRDDIADQLIGLGLAEPSGPLLIRGADARDEDLYSMADVELEGVRYAPIDDEI